jgi:glucose/arabinose dehydrogenase
MRLALSTLIAVMIVVAACTDEDRPPRGEPLPPAEPNGEVPPSAPGRPFDPDAVELSLEVVADGFIHPLAVVDPGDDSGRLFVVEQDGAIKILRDGRVSPEPFLDLTDLTEASGEQGLLGLAFHPRYETTGRLFVNYTDVGGDTVVAEYHVSDDDPDRADGSPARVLLRIDQPFPNHNGGAVVFGPDGYLYIGTGDGGSGGDPHGNGQRLDTLLGKILRVDVDRRGPQTAYSIPSDNPFVDRSDARPEIWAYGLRNPWRFTFDRVAGMLWIGDVGQGDLEEIDRAPAASPGLNYGWNVMEGSACFEPPDGCNGEGLVLPITEYTHDDGCSVTGGFVYRGDRFPALHGGYLFGDFCSGTIWAINAGARGPVAPAEILQTDHAISSFGEDEAGELYLTDLSSGTVLRVTATRP